VVDAKLIFLKSKYIKRIAPIWFLNQSFHFGAWLFLLLAVASFFIGLMADRKSKDVELRRKPSRMEFQLTTVYTVKSLDSVISTMMARGYHLDYEDLEFVQCHMQFDDDQFRKECIEQYFKNAMTNDGLEEFNRKNRFFTDLQAQLQPQKKFPGTITKLDG